MRLPSRPWLVRGAVLVLVVSLFAPAAVGAMTYDPSGQKALQPGTVTSPANGTTVVSVQGYTFNGQTNPKKPARLVAADERANTKWVYNSSEGKNAWFFDVDPLPGGNLLVVSPRSGKTVIYELNPETRERVWERTFPFEDTHDADMLSEDELIISHMRAWDGENGVSEDEIVVYNLTTNERTWEWKYKNHFPENTDGGMNADWSHSNDVDPISDDRIVLSPRNFDQAVIVDMETKEVTNTLGEDGDHSILNEQHNPDYLVSENGTPTMLVADSGNNRIVEYAYENGEWVRTWTVGRNTLNWPRDADRLPNGNTLVTDTLNHRVLEITPTGEVVWEYYATWGPYDAERIAHGDESNGPTIRDMGKSGTYPITGSAELTAGGDESLTFKQTVRNAFAGTPLDGYADSFARLWGHYAPWLRPVWMTGWDMAFALFGGVLLLGWVGTESVLGVRRLAGDRWPTFGIRDGMRERLDDLRTK
ncbi:aryl-sulfate sulfotransferase [Haloarchaeobius sp. DFWS5]|uniref:aryl-sulfate sulfotransferase n=1 Tax=Haloarchaeobius sp. DFWS5 TaxID=3446114 RepID=UPI003EBFA65D